MSGRPRATPPPRYSDLSCANGMTHLEDDYDSESSGSQNGNHKNTLSNSKASAQQGGQRRTLATILSEKNIMCDTIDELDLGVESRDTIRDLNLSAKSEKGIALYDMGCSSSDSSVMLEQPTPIRDLRRVTSSFYEPAPHLEEQQQKKHAQRMKELHDQKIIEQQISNFNKAHDSSNSCDSSVISAPHPYTFHDTLPAAELSAAPRSHRTKAVDKEEKYYDAFLNPLVSPANSFYSSSSQQLDSSVVSPMSIRQPIQYQQQQTTPQQQQQSQFTFQETRPMMQNKSTPPLPPPPPYIEVVQQQQREPSSAAGIATAQPPPAIGHPSPPPPYQQQQEYFYPTAELTTARLHGHAVSNGQNALSRTNSFRSTNSGAGTHNSGFSDADNHSQTNSHAHSSASHGHSMLSPSMQQLIDEQIQAAKLAINSTQNLISSPLPSERVQASTYDHHHGTSHMQPGHHGRGHSHGHGQGGGDMQSSSHSIASGGGRSSSYSPVPHPSVISQAPYNNQSRPVMTHQQASSQQPQQPHAKALLRPESKHSMRSHSPGVDELAASMHHMAPPSSRHHPNSSYHEQEPYLSSSSTQPKSRSVTPARSVEASSGTHVSEEQSSGSNAFQSVNQGYQQSHYGVSPQPGTQQHQQRHFEDSYSQPRQQNHQQQQQHHQHYQAPPPPYIPPSPQISPPHAVPIKQEAAVVVVDEYETKIAEYMSLGFDQNQAVDMYLEYVKNKQKGLIPSAHGPADVIVVPSAAAARSRHASPVPTRGISPIPSSQQHYHQQPTDYNKQPLQKSYSDPTRIYYDQTDPASGGDKHSPRHLGAKSLSDANVVSYPSNRSVVPQGFTTSQHQNMPRQQQQEFQSYQQQLQHAEAYGDIGRDDEDEGEEYDQFDPEGVQRRVSDDASLPSVSDITESTEYQHDPPSFGYNATSNQWIPPQAYLTSSGGGLRSMQQQQQQQPQSGQYHNHHQPSNGRYTSPFGQQQSHQPQYHQQSPQHQQQQSYSSGNSRTSSAYNYNPQFGPKYVLQAFDTRTDDDLALHLAILMSEQEARFGINMLDFVKTRDFEGEIYRLMRNKGFSRTTAIEIIFDRTHVN